LFFKQEELLLSPCPVL